MKKEDYYLAKTYAHNLGLIVQGTRETLDENKLRNYVKTTPETLRLFLEALKDIDSTAVKPGDAVLCPDKKTRLVVECEYVETETEFKIAIAKLIDVGGFVTKEKIENLKKLK